MRENIQKSLNASSNWTKAACAQLAIAINDGSDDLLRGSRTLHPTWLDRNLTGKLHLDLVLESICPTSSRVVQPLHKSWLD